MSPKRFTMAPTAQWVSSEAENRTSSEQTHSALVVCDWMISRKSVTFAALFSCCMAGATRKCCRHGARCVYTIQPCISLGRVHVCLAVTSHLCFRQNDLDLLRATTITCGWNWYRNNSTENLPWRRKFSHRTWRDSNLRPFDHESVVVLMIWAIPTPQH